MAGSFSTTASTSASLLNIPNENLITPIAFEYGTFIAYKTVEAV